MGGLAPTLDPPVVRDNQPAISHYRDATHPGPDIRALCGAQVIDVRAPLTAPLCETCAFLSKVAA